MWAVTPPGDEWGETLRAVETARPVRLDRWVGGMARVHREGCMKDRFCAGQRFPRPNPDAGGRQLRPTRIREFVGEFWNP